MANPSKKKITLKEVTRDFVPNPNCVLVTPYTRYKGIPDSTLEYLEKVRRHDSEIGPIDIKNGTKLKLGCALPHGRVFQLRNYQTQTIAHAIYMRKFIIGDAVGLGKTICAIAAACNLYDKKENYKIIVLTTRSTTYQWASEFETYSELRPWVLKSEYKDMKGSEARLAQISQFLNGTKRDVLIAKYTSLIGTRRVYDEGDVYDDNGDPLPDNKKEAVSPEIRELAEILEKHKGRVLLILDEAHKFKNPETSIRTLVENISYSCDRVIAMTASSIKNRLTEFYGIAYAIGIRPFGFEEGFQFRFCNMVKKHIGNGRYKREIRGYKNVPEFKAGMRPWFYGRSQAQVKEKLPKLSTQFHQFNLSKKEAKLLLEDIPSGNYPLPPRLIKFAGEVIDEQARDMSNLMTCMSVYQMVANSSALLDPDDPKRFKSKTLSTKESELLDLLEGDLAGEKVIVFTKYRKWINRLEWLNDNGHFSSRKFLRITGAESEIQRETNRKLFQDDPAYDLIFINAAGIEGINLQTAAHMIILDCPWSWGDLLQLVGRMVRMSSPNSACMLHVLVAMGTIDEYIIEILRSKKGIFEIILGSTYSAGVLDDGNQLLDLASSMDQVDDAVDFSKMLNIHAKSVGIKNFLSGDLLTSSQKGKRKVSLIDNKKVRRDPSDMADLWRTDESIESMARRVSESGGLGLIDDE